MQLARDGSGYFHSSSLETEVCYLRLYVRLRTREYQHMLGVCWYVSTWFRQRRLVLVLSYIRLRARVVGVSSYE